MNHRLLIVASFCLSLWSGQIFSEPDVVDSNENFALLEEQQADYQPPVAQADHYSDRESERPLAHEDRHVGKNNPELLEKIQGLQQEVQELRGQLEVQAHQLKQLQEQQLSFYKDLDERLRNAASNTSPEKKAETNLDMDELSKTPPSAHSTEQQPSVTPSSVEKGPSNPADEQIKYLAAYDLITSKQYDNAITEMNEFIAKYPQSGYSANAHYWLGEVYMIKHDYSKAMEHFNAVLQTFPSSNKAGACLLKLGYAQIASGDVAKGKNTLQDVIKKYPDTQNARFATTKLNSLKHE